MASDDENVLMLRSRDNVLVPISYKAAQQSQILSDMLEDIDESGVTEVPITEVDGEILNMIVAWCTAKAQDVAAQLALQEARNLERAQRRQERKERAEARAAETGEAPVESSSSGSSDGPPQQAWGRFVSRCDPWKAMINEDPFIPPTWPERYLEDLPQEQIFALITAANFFDIHDLFEACAQVLAARVQYMSTEEMRGYFGVQNDFTEDEESQIRDDHGWTWSGHTDLAPK
ncbi:Skp1-domain-containing protein [Daldinia bambusicola]|nr:Skp1-domain-containing protein [Daldinia bambusicola]